MPLARAASLLRRLASKLSSRFSYECRSVPGPSSISSELLLRPPFELIAIDGSQSNASCIDCDESQLTSCTCNLEREYIEAVESTNEPQVLPKEMSRKELYVYDDEIKQARTLGVGFASHAIELVVISALRERSLVKKSFSDLNVSLFNMHSTRLADSLIKRDVGSLCLVEASQNNARLMKDYARKAHKNDGKRIQAYQADFTALFPVYTRKRQTPPPSKLLFGDKALIKDAQNPLILQRRLVGDESGTNNSNSPVVIGTLPLPSQQAAMLNSLTWSLIMHHCCINTMTMFKYGAVYLITFLSAGNYAAAICGVADDLKFTSNAQRHQSWLLNRLFEVISLRDRKGFSRNAFTPIIPLHKTIAHEKKLAEVGIRNGLMYGVSIRPRSTLQIGSLTVVSGVGAEEYYDPGVVSASDVLLKYAFWLTITGKLTSKTNVYDKLRQWFPESVSKITSEIGSSTRMADMEMHQFDMLFSALHNDINETCALSGDMAKFIAKLRPASTAKRFAD